MRCVLMAEFLGKSEPELVVQVLSILINRAATTTNHRDLAAAECLGMTLSQADLLPYQARVDLYAAAKHAGRDEIARLFFDASPAPPDSAEIVDAMSAERRVVPRGRVLTLGERKTLARSHRRDLLMHIARDPHPDVVKILLGNPHLTESDVVSMAARRPAMPEALAAVATHPRWGVRYPVKRALAFNPYTPVHLAIRLVTTMRATDLRAIAQDAHLARPLRDQARALLEQR